MEAKDFGFGYSVEIENGLKFRAVNYKKILAFSEEEVILKTKKSHITIRGRGLKILELQKGVMELCGKILAVEFGE